MFINCKLVGSTTSYDDNLQRRYLGKGPCGVEKETRGLQSALDLLPIVLASRALKVETALLAAEVDST